MRFFCSAFARRTFLLRRGFGSGSARCCFAPWARTFFFVTRVIKAFLKRDVLAPTGIFACGCFALCGAPFCVMLEIVSLQQAHYALASSSFSCAIATAVRRVLYFHVPHQTTAPGLVRRSISDEATVLQLLVLFGSTSSVGYGGGSVLRAK